MKLKNLLQKSPSMSLDSVSSTISESNAGVEISARNLLDITFKYTWRIQDYLHLLDSKVNIDSPTFEFHLNGLRTKWSLGIRFWSDEDGARLSNPVVVCLNLVSSSCEDPEEVEVRYQFGVWNDAVKQYEVCPVGSQSVSLAGPVSQDFVSVGYREVCILDPHLHGGKDHTVELFCKIMLLRTAVEKNTLALDLWSKMRSHELCDVTLVSKEGDSHPAHKTILSCRSEGLHKVISKATDDTVHLDMSTTVLTGLLQYIYTDRVDPLVTPTALLKVAVNMNLPGLKNICEKALVDAITPVNVANMLMIADSFSCESLKKAGLSYVEENTRCIVKNIAWKVMEDVNPQLFEEVCQSQG